MPAPKKIDSTVRGGTDLIATVRSRKTGKIDSEATTKLNNSNALANITQENESFTLGKLTNRGIRAVTSRDNKRVINAGIKSAKSAKDSPVKKAKGGTVAKKKPKKKGK